MRGLLLTVVLSQIFLTSQIWAQDMEIRDTVYFLEPSYEISSCDPTVEVTLPIYLFSDWPTWSYSTTLQLDGGVEFDTAYGYSLGECDNVVVVYSRDYEGYEGSSYGLSVQCGGLFGCCVTPAAGTAMVFKLTAEPSDTLRLHSVMPAGFLLGDGIYWWSPFGAELDTVFVVPDTLTLSSGDANCSNSVTISDAVYLINFIFGGGPSPYDLNAADPDQSCGVSIADAVYIINYIFGGGPAPLPGCVVE